VIATDPWTITIIHGFGFFFRKSGSFQKQYGFAPDVRGTEQKMEFYFLPRCRREGYPTCEDENSVTNAHAIKTLKKCSRHARPINKEEKRREEKPTYDEGHALPPLRLLLPHGLDLRRLRSLLLGSHV